MKSVTSKMFSTSRPTGRVFFFVVVDHLLNAVRDNNGVASGELVNRHADGGIAPLRSRASMLNLTTKADTSHILAR